MNLKMKIAIACICLMGTIIAGCGDKKEQTKANKPAPQTQQVNGIAIPNGYKLFQTGQDNIVVKSATENQMGGPAIIYKRDDVTLSAKVITDCMGPKSIIGGHDGELVTLYKDGRVSVVTAVGSTDLYRYYNSDGSLLLIKKGDDRGGWAGSAKAAPCNLCGKVHSSEKYARTYRFTSFDGVKKTLNAWK